MKKARLTLHVDGKEVRVDGNADAVRRQVDHLLDRVLDAAGEDRVLTFSLGPVPVPPPPVHVDDGDVEEWKLAVARGRQDVLEALRACTLRYLDFPRLFNAHAENVHLLFLPEKGPDYELEVMMLLLFGRLVCLGRAYGTGKEILDDARRYGCRTRWVRGLFDEHPGLVTCTGRAAARRKEYRLTAAGVERCDRLMRTFLAGNG